MKNLKFTETALRDGHQSLIATRLKTEEILPVLDIMDNIGYYAMEVWGGATFDTCLRYLNEDPWERLREIRKRVKNTKLQMLLRGQNILGYKHYPDDIVEKFINKSVENGIDIIRVFDALNDIRNLEMSIKSIKKAGAHCQCAISYTTSEIHTIGYYLELMKTMENLGSDSICIKDMAGILTPKAAYELISKAKNEVKIPLELHSHCTSGIAGITYEKAVEAGVDIIDTALSPFAGGTSQPSTEALAMVFQEAGYNPNLDVKKLNEVAGHLRKVKQKYAECGIFDAKVMEIEPKTLTYQVPGGMLSNLLSQLKAQNASDKYEEVLKEVPRVRADLGYPPLVTPLSQMVGTQAVFNVLTGERYKMVPKEIKDYVSGFYGKSPAPIDTEIKEKIIGNTEVITVRPADLLEPGFENAKKEIQGLAKTEEDVLSYAIFPQIAKTFFEEKLKEKNVKQKMDDESDECYYIDISY